MEPEFITYQKFDDIVLAEALIDLLEENEIAYETEEEAFRFDPSLVLSNAKKEYAVKIKGDDFGRVTQLLQANEAENIDGVEQDYYLFSFTDEELMEVVTKADEWSAFDVVLAKKILADRGKPISDDIIEKIEEQRIEELKTPEPPQTFWVTIGYVIAFTSIVLPFFICVIGLFIGWYLSSFKKTLPDGERVFGYTEKDRRNGKRIFYLSIIIFFLNIAVLILYNVYFNRD
ncbi:MAG TPA: hypothetical protein VFE53_20160 [Mucilaginibacter sp.]|jgi:hypothetical protein|nr:hypothetical protein [Mucilaginibacter sp.]